MVAKLQSAGTGCPRLCIPDRIYEPNVGNRRDRVGDAEMHIGGHHRRDAMRRCALNTYGRAGPDHAGAGKISFSHDWRHLPLYTFLGRFARTRASRQLTAVAGCQRPRRRCANATSSLFSSSTSVSDSGTRRATRRSPLEPEADTSILTSSSISGESKRGRNSNAR